MNSFKKNIIIFLSLLLLGCGGSLDDDDKNAADETKLPEDEGEIILEKPAEPGVPSSFVYVGAQPSWLAISETGGGGRSEVSVVSFKLVDRNQDPVSGFEVDFSLQGPSGTEIEPVKGTTNEEGIVSTTVTSGKVNGTVRVTVNHGEIKLVSDALAVSTGLPDQDSFSLSLGTVAPEGMVVDGKTSAVTIRLADHFNNSVPDGTAVSFTTEGGAIRLLGTDSGPVGSCLTKNGTCELEWVSQNPRPDGNTLNDEGLSGDKCAVSTVNNQRFAPCINPGGMGRPYGREVTITAFALGEESFFDTNGNGWFDEKDLSAFKLNYSNDLDEVFFDYNEDAVKDINEEFHDFSPKDQTYSYGNKEYNGVLCSSDALTQGICSRKLINVWGNVVLTMAASASDSHYFRVQDVPGDVNVSSKDVKEVTIDAGKIVTLSVAIADIYNNRPPTNSVISITTTAGRIVSTPTWELSNTFKKGPLKFTIKLTEDTKIKDEDGNVYEPPKTGVATIAVTTPSGGLSTYLIDVTIKQP